MEGFFSRLLYKEENTYLHKYVLHSVHARTYCTNKRIEYYNMCNTATLRTVGLHIVLTCLSGSGAFPLLRAVGTMWGEGAGPGDVCPPPFLIMTDWLSHGLVSGWGTDYAHHSTTRPSGFSNLPTALLLDMGYHLYFRPWPYRCILCSAIEYSIASMHSA